ncbi:MAG TPA: DNA polymerase III subunit delta' [Castellaniella sp.]|uniref:DNA polymerase III subunit delta' n=1 Tax=Castellaniella sp. TaxID=1955812 RepID=UPI002F0AD768
MNHVWQFLPWQLAPARQWLDNRTRFAHAWLIHGTPGIGQLAFALAGAASLLCESPRSGLACGECEACRWVANGNHPDLRRIRPEAQAIQEGDAEQEGNGKKQASREIRVEQIRELLPWFNMASHRGGWRVAVIYPAEALNTISANALLKILEEPPAHTVFLLVANAPDRLLATLVSRCRRLPLPIPALDRAQNWLKGQGVAEAGGWLAAAGGAPVLAQQMSATGTTPVPAWLETFLNQASQGSGATGALADALLVQEPAVWLDAAQRLWFDLALAARGLPLRYYPGKADAIEVLAQSLDSRALADGASWLLEQRRLAQHPLNPKFLADYAAQVLLSAVRKV